MAKRSSPSDAVAKALELYRLYYVEGQRQPSYLAELYRLLDGFEIREADTYYRLVRPMVLQEEVRRPPAPAPVAAPVADLASRARPPYRLVVPDPTQP